MVFILVMAGGLVLRAQDNRGALAISPTIVILVGKHGVIHGCLILIPDVVAPVGVVSEEPLSPPSSQSSSSVADAASSSTLAGSSSSSSWEACETGSSSSPSAPTLSLLPSNPPASVADASSSSSCSPDSMIWILVKIQRLSTEQK